MAFRSGLDERVADLLCELGVKYEYESTKILYVIQHNYTPDFLLPTVCILNVRDTGMLMIDARLKQLRRLIQTWT